MKYHHSGDDNIIFFEHDATGIMTIHKEGVSW